MWVVYFPVEGASLWVGIFQMTLIINTALLVNLKPVLLPLRGLCISLNILPFLIQINKNGLLFHLLTGVGPLL